MNTELQTALYAALAVGVLSILANVIRQAMWNQNDFRLARNESRQSFLQMQISELYSPLLGYLHEAANCTATLKQVVSQLRESCVDDPAIEEKIAAVHDRFEREHFEPLRLKVTDLLMSKRHLVVEDRFPQYLDDLLACTTRWEASRTVHLELGLTPTAGGSCSGHWPQRVVNEVERTLLDLRTEYRRSLRLAGKLR